MVYIILAMLLYAIGILFGTAASRHTNTNVAAAITNIVSAIIPIAVAAPLLSKKIVNQKFGLAMAVATGVCVALFVLAINKAYALNKVGIVTPIVFGGAIFLSTLLSYFIFKEKVNTLQFIGLVILAIGFGIVIYARATLE